MSPVLWLTSGSSPPQAVAGGLIRTMNQKGGEHSESALRSSSYSVLDISTQLSYSVTTARGVSSLGDWPLSHYAEVDSGVSLPLGRVTSIHLPHSEHFVNLHGTPPEPEFVWRPGALLTTT